MKLSEYVDLYRDKEVIKIGAASGFVFCGSYEDYLKDIDGISAEWLDKAELTIARCKRDLNVSKPDIGLNDFKFEMIKAVNDWDTNCCEYESVKEFLEIQQTTIIKKLKATTERLANLVNVIIKKQIYVDRFIKFQDREVKEAYTVPYKDNEMCFIVEGDENGDYYDKEEYDRANNLLG